MQNVIRSYEKCRLLLSDLNQLEYSRQILIKLPAVRFHEDPQNRGCVRTRRRMGRHRQNEATNRFRNLEKAPNLLLCIVCVSPYILHCSKHAVTAPLRAFGNQVMANESTEPAELLHRLEAKHK